MENGELTLWCNLLRVTHLQMRHRRGEHCSPAARPEPVQGTATHPVNHNVGAQCAPLRDNVYRLDRTVNHGRKTVQIRPEKTFSKKFEKRVDETGILLYTKQVVSDESSKTTTT